MRRLAEVAVVLGLLAGQAWGDWPAAAGGRVAGLARSGEARELAGPVEEARPTVQDAPAAVNTTGPRSPEDLPNPDLLVPVRFRGDSQEGGAGSLGNLRWFEIFQDAQLKALIQEALVHNPDLRTAITRVDAARANLGIVASAQWPTIGFQTDYTNTQQSANSPNYFRGFLARQRSFGEVLLNLFSFELDIWGRVARQVESAEQLEIASQWERNAVMCVVVGDVASGYFNLIELDAELEIDRQTLATRQESLRLITIRQQGGVATMLDVRQAEQLVEQAQLTYATTRGMLAQQENNLNLLLGRPPGPVPRGLPLTEQPPAPDVPAGLPSELLERRPDIVTAEHQLQAQDALVEAARRAYFPAISLSAALGFQSQALSTMFRGESITAQLVPQVAFPIFDAGKSRATELQITANQVLAVINYQKVVLTAFRDVSNALAQHTTSREARASQETLVAILTDRKRLAYLRYQGGVDTLLNALDADRDLFQAQLSLAQARRNELLSLVQLYRALGGGWQPPVL